MNETAAEILDDAIGRNVDLPLPWLDNIHIIEETMSSGSNILRVLSKLEARTKINIIKNRILWYKMLKIIRYIIVQNPPMGCKPVKIIPFRVPISAFGDFTFQ
jgi:hypothetical protein